MSGTDDKKIKIMPAAEIGGSKRSSELKIDMKDDMYSSSQEDLKKLQNDTILKRIPAGAEATTVLVSHISCFKNSFLFTNHTITLIHKGWCRRVP